MNQIIFLIIILVLVIGFPLFSKLNNYAEGFNNSSLDEAKVLVQDMYPFIGKNEISNETSADMWWHYPIFELGSYDQITNNIRYPNNPDIGNCTPASMCGALYHERKTGTNYVEQLPPVNPNSGTRIGYFTTENNLLPFRANTPNILY